MQTKPLTNLRHAARALWPVRYAALALTRSAAYAGAWQPGPVLTLGREAALRQAVTRLATLVALLLALLTSLAPTGIAHGAPAEQRAFTSGTVIALRGTPHLWFVDEQGRLHWSGDTRALAGHDINWNSKVELALDQLKALPMGDPWLSAGLLKDGDPIYLVKWEANQDRPTLLRIQSMADVELFGINGRNYGQFVLERAEWERRYGMAAGTLPRAELAPAAPAAPKPGEVLVADNFDEPAKGVMPKQDDRRFGDPYAFGYEGGEYVLRTLTADADDYPAPRVPGTYANASLAVDARLAGSADGRLILLGCRENAARDRGYVLLVSPGDGEFALIRGDGDDAARLVNVTPSAAIRRGTQSNRIELSCAGNRITARINGTQVASVQDGTYSEGRMFIGTMTFKPGITSEVRFDNLVVTQQ